MTYQEMMEKINMNKGSKGNVAVGRVWKYNDPIKVVIIDLDEKQDSQIDVTIAFKAGNKIIEKIFPFHTEGKASNYWNEFIEKAFPKVDELTGDDILGRPFVVEIVRNERFDNIKVLSGYEGDFPEEAEGLE